MIRKMTTDDIFKIVNLEEKIFKQSLGVNFFYDELTINPFAHYYIMENIDELIGYIGYRIYDENAEILNFIIDSKYQKQGYGKQLLNDTLNNFVIKTVSLEVRESNNQAINFYIKNDFKYSHKRLNYYDNEDAHVYIKEV